jgi:molecular chaperone GrpE
MPEPTLLDLADKIDDVARLVTRQTGVLSALTGSAGAAARPDVPLLVELHALRNDALGCAATARTRRERAAFTAIAAGLERLLVGRGGQVVEPAVGDAFTGMRMDAVEVLPTVDSALDRTVAEVREPGLTVGERSVRPARVAVYAVRPSNST